LLTLLYKHQRVLLSHYVENIWNIVPRQLQAVKYFLGRCMGQWCGNPKSTASTINNVVLSQCSPYTFPN